MHIPPGESTNMYKCDHKMAGKRMKMGSSRLDEYMEHGKSSYTFVAVCLVRGFKL